MEDKKKLKEEYKQIVHPKGIYTIKNKETGKVYLASSMNLHGVLEREKFILKMGNHRCEPLQKDWKKFGEAAFNIEINETLELKDDPTYDYNEDLQILEMMWIEKFQPFAEKCYNRNEKIRTA